MARLARLTALVQEQAETNKTGPSAPYRIWVDTLCCPVDLKGKLVALQRIADVYRQATHVLVLDSSLAAFKSEGTHPAELLLRTFGASPWMRRLWTLQGTAVASKLTDPYDMLTAMAEGALGSSLYIQFADRAVDSSALLHRLFAAGCEDTRYMRIWQDVVAEVSTHVSR